MSDTPETDAQVFKAGEVDPLIRVVPENLARRLERKANRLNDACNGMIGLMQLLCHRSDAPEWLIDAMQNHRVLEALEATHGTRRPLQALAENEGSK